MEDLKKLIFPAIAAILLHGLLFIFKLPKQHLKPVLKAAPIEIQINSISPSTNISKKVEQKKERIIRRPKPEKSVVPKEITKPPIKVPEQPEKKELEPELTQEKPNVREIEKKVDHDKLPIEKQSNNANTLSSKKIEDPIAEPITVESTETFQPEERSPEPEESFSKELFSTSPIQKKAVPVYRRNSQPSYPVMARRRGQQGEVLLTVLVDTAGRVAELKIKQSSGYQRLDQAALKAVKGWLFTPALEGDTFVAMWVDVPIIFQLK